MRLRTCSQILRGHRASMIWWAIGLVGFLLIELAAFPSVRDAAGMQDIWNQMPDAMKAMFGMDATLDLSSGAGFLEAELFGLMLPLCFLIIGITSGSKVIAGEEADGTLELTLAHPVTRTRLLLESFLATAIIVTIPAIVVFVTLAVGDPIAGIDVPITKLFAACARLALFGIVFAALALAVGGAVGRRSLTVGICGAAALGAFLASTLSRLITGLEPVGRLSPFNWLFGTHPVLAGFTSGLLTAAVLASLLVAAGALAFDRRDLR